jgi:hypothetical protein
MRPVILTMIVAAAAPVACTNTLEPNGAGAFTAERTESEVALHNGTDQPVYYLVSDVADPTQLLALLCAGPRCISVPSGEQATVLLTDAGFDPNVETVFVHWWFAVLDGDHFRPDRIRTIALDR